MDIGLLSDMDLQSGDLADAVEDTRRRTGVEPVPKLKVSSTNPESKKRVG